MNAYINYLVEANLGLCLFLAFYFVLLRKESDFTWKRTFLLLGIFLSLLFPLLHFTTDVPVIASISDAIPALWLQEIVIQGSGNAANTGTPSIHDFWQIVRVTYGIGMLFFVIRFLIRLSQLLLLIRRNKTYQLYNLRVVESPENKPTFSFFRFIFIGQSDALSEKEKHQILQHERIHAQQLHSLDVLLLNILGIFFWFNPVLIIYKKIFVQLHEFEADARAVTNHDVNDYCSLLARVALLSADIKLANHFNNSLTLKRIQMMRTMKTKIHRWKIAAMALVIPLFFVVIACQEQVMNEVSEVAKSSSMALDVPEEVQAKYDALAKAKPDKKLLLIEMDQQGQAKLEEVRLKMENLKPDEIASIEVIKIPAKGTDPARAFAIVEYNEMINKISDLSRTDDVFTVVEESATPKIGMEAFYKYIMQNLRYPIEARTKGVEGKVFIQFIVQKNGTLTDFTVLKGVDPALDNEAIRVLQGASEWNPGKQAGVIVKQKVVMPINFRINGSDHADQTENPDRSLSEVVAVGNKNN